MSALPPEDVERRKALRREWNRRYREKLKRGDRNESTQTVISATSLTPGRNGVHGERPGISRAQSSTHTLPPRPPPIPNGPTPHVELSKELDKLNQMLRLWDFHTESHLAYRKRVGEELQEATLRGEVEEWVAQKERWIDEGDHILQAL
ncbi:hypothetical protein L226DRAFT_575620 [Lentinus tigrinus ALCF2SS1-7]|uniref:uncharacterized protein n=1 Tax=Lentinus tigrinus ALCF2SS1-7 TaxID=1328758 RepID=UPI00116629BD|nr:hypothetical protein L226DRAFT_575620 [Lentinus tigrinus ALCF2SS1-7]